MNLPIHYVLFPIFVFMIFVLAGSVMLSKGIAPIKVLVERFKKMQFYFRKTRTEMSGIINIAWSHGSNCEIKLLKFSHRQKFY